jgi:hypothetical protein
MDTLLESIAVELVPEIRIDEELGLIVVQRVSIFLE